MRQKSGKSPRETHIQDPVGFIKDLNEQDLSQTNAYANEQYFLTKKL